jgi:hypothetical protein
MVFVLLLSSRTIFSQATASGTLQGTIMDKTQAVINGANVTISNKTTGLTRSVTTNEIGTFRFDLLPAGVYEVKVGATGFSSATSDNVQILVGKTLNLDFTLSPGVQTETVTITGEVPLVDTEKTSVGLNITPSEVRDLPLNGRDFANLAYLAPGAQPVNSYDPTKNRIAIFGINGSSGRNVNVTVNGVDNKDNTVGGPVMQFPLEAIQEFIISTQRFSAANGRSEGAAVNVITKSGGNDFHGSLFLFERNERLNANDYFTKQGNGEKSPFSRQQFGGSIGGPIRKDTDFFFFALERQREQTNIVVAPDALKELQLVTNLKAYNIQGAQPAANIPTPYRDWRYSARYDHRFNANHSMFISYNAQTNRGDNDQSGSRNDLTGGNFTTNDLQLANFTLNSVLSPTVVNAFTVGFQYWNNLIDSEVKVPTINFPGGIYFGTNGNVPQQSYQRKWQFRDDVSFNLRKHSLKTGFDYLWEPTLGGFFEFNPTLNLTFLDLPSVILNNRTKYPQGFATPGAVTGMTATSGNPYFDLPGGSKMFGLYFQDDWRVRRNLTFNIGLRWDKDFNLIGAKAQEKSRTYLQLKAVNSPYASRLPKDDNKDFSPRVGFAWDVTGTTKHTIRGGYGIYYGQPFLNIPLFMIQQANPTIFATVLALASSGPGDAGADIVPGANVRLSSWRFGVDPLPTIPPPPTAFRGGEVGRIMDPDYKNPYSQQWNIGYVFELTPTSVIEVDYVHGLALRESKRNNINPRRVNAGNARDHDARFRAAGLPLLAQIVLEHSVGRSRYDGLNIAYRRRMSRRLSLNTHYVLSRAVAYNGHSAAFANTPTNVDNIFAKHDFGPVPNDERHRWVLSGLVDLPYGFQVAPIMQLASARPYNATQGLDVFGFGGGIGAAHVILQKNNPNNLTATKDMTAAQLRACIATGDCFQAGFNILRGHEFFQLDTRVTKNVKLGETRTLKLIFQAFDVTNRANFGNNFIGNVRSSSFMKPAGFITPSGVIVPRSFSAELAAQFVF